VIAYLDGGNAWAAERLTRELQRSSLAGRRCSTGLRLWCLPSSLSS
jgi:hypothetical protein